MALTDSDLMMIENLTYALSKSNPAYDYEKKPLSACRTVGEYLNQFDDDLLKKLEIYGIELNIIDFSEGKIEQLSEILKRFDLQLTMIASGAYAKMYGMNLSSTDEVIRQKGVDALAYMLNRASRMNAGVICGYMKGEAAGYRESAERQMIKCLSELDYMGV